jgi:hypothetical protein
MLLSSQSMLVRDQAAWALANLAGDGLDCRDQILRLGAGPPLVRLLGTPIPQVWRSAAFAVSNLIRGDGANPRPFLEAGVLQAVLSALTSFKMAATQPEREAISEGLQLLAQLTDNNPQVVAELARLGVAPMVAGLLESAAAVSAAAAAAAGGGGGGVGCGGEPPFQVSSLLRVLGNLAAGSDALVTQLFAARPGVAQALVFHLASPLEHVKLECGWALANITGGLTDHSRALVEAGVLPFLVGMLAAGPTESRKEALAVLLNLGCRGGPTLAALIAANTVAETVLLLKWPDTELKLLVLQLLELVCRHHPGGVAIVERHGGVAALEAQQFAKAPQISALVADLLTRNFPSVPAPTTFDF